MRRLAWLFVVLLPMGMSAQNAPAPDTLPASATVKLSDSLKSAAKFDRHIWRDTPPLNADGTINGYVEIPLGDRHKWEFDMAANARAIDRVMPEAVGGYPINYGFVPQTVSYDGDPFDVLVLGSRLTGGLVVRGVAVGVMLMEDEKGLDSKVVISPTDDAGRPLHQLTAAVRDAVGEYFRRYKRHEPGAWSRVPGWGSAEDGMSLVRRTHAFFKECRKPAAPCRVSR